LVRAWAIALSRVLGIDVDVRGTPPRPPFLLVCNHLSYVDVLVLAAHVDASFVAKAEIARWPLVGRLCRAVDTLFVDRGSKRALPEAVEQLGSWLENGRGVVLFPEGTSSDGSSVLPFRSPLLEIAAAGGWPVSYAALSYAVAPEDPPARVAVCWWGEAGFLGHLWGLLALARIRARVVFGAAPICESDRKLLASKLWTAVEATRRVSSG
ncbi:MAG TPA: lysophospholipid acyltransferase family protein, partial [Candidatus Polarisedimenticolaceae bacterium]|nr:lysophospholipid acyltransferase family protein [Candidatus Polarisedimenticolaceae bacterium]